MEGYWVDLDLYPCRLTGSDLAHLLQLVEQGFPGPSSPADLEIRSYLPGVTAQGHSLDEYLAAEGLPRAITRLEIRRVHRDAAQEVDQAVELTLLPNLARLWISGRDELLVLAKRKQLCEFLRAHRPWYWPLAGRWAWAGLLLAAALPCALALAGGSDLPFTLGVAAGLLALAGAALLEYHDRLMPHTHVVIDQAARPQPTP